ncbi:hypothetical protein EV714DRAFT_277063 [Schizophyllum commune]
MHASSSTSSAAHEVKRTSRKPSLSIEVKRTQSHSYTEDASDASGSQNIIIPAESEFFTPSDEERHFNTPFDVGHRPMCVACDDGVCMGGGDMEDGPRASACMEDGPRASACMVDARVRAMKDARSRRDPRITSCHPFIDVDNCEYADSCELRSPASPSLIAHLSVYIGAY